MSTPRHRRWLSPVETLLAFRAGCMAGLSLAKWLGVVASEGRSHDDRRPPGLFQAALAAPGRLPRDLGGGRLSGP
ncbi:MAG TPA: hypothetical protein VEL76_15095 [Gemmataceae bacterium]|nr:hypothetical protein [Gemmataceae bacterium]